MNIDTIKEKITAVKNKKPWFIPKWVWNTVVSLAYEQVKPCTNIETVCTAAGTAMMDIVQKAVTDKDDAALARVCQTIETASQVFGKISAAAKDKSITDEEKKEVCSTFVSIVSSVVSQEDMDTAVAEVRDALVFS